MELKNLNNAWLSPYGQYITTHHKFYDEPFAWHNRLANCILIDKFEVDDFLDLSKRLNDEGFSYAYEYLENQGWVRLHGFGGLPPKFVKVKNKLTPEQELAVIDWCVANNVKYDDCFTS